MTALYTEGMRPGSLSTWSISILFVTVLEGQRIHTSIRAPMNAGNLDVLE